MARTRIPPHDEDAEQAVLGAFLIDKEAVTLASDKILPDFFYNEHNKIIYEGMLELFQSQMPIDIVTLTSLLKKKKLLDIVGGSAYITSLASTVPTASHILHYATILQDHYIRRSLITLSSQITDMAFDEMTASPEILNKAEHGVFKLSQASIKQGFVHIKETLAQSFDKLDEVQNNNSTIRGLATGFIELDGILSGLQDSNLIVLAARPGQGKTAFVINIAQYISVHEKNAVGIFSLEMSKEELVDRLLVSQADIDAWKLKTGRLTDEDYTKLSDAMGMLSEAQIFIDDTPGITINEIRTKARRLQMEHNVRLLVVDYLQLADPGKKFESRVQEVTHISQSLKNLARELKVPVIAVSQLSRAVEHRGERKPQLADLRESGAIEQDADVVLFLYSAEEEMTSQRIVKILIAKHRNGPTGEKDLLFRGDRIRFYNVDHTNQLAG